MKQRVIKNCSTWIPCWPSSVGRDYGLLFRGSILGESMLAHVVVMYTHTDGESMFAQVIILGCGHVDTNDASCVVM